MPMLGRLMKLMAIRQLMDSNGDQDQVSSERCYILCWDFMNWCFDKIIGLPPLMPFPRQICADGEIPPQGDPTSVAQISSGNDKEDTIPPPPYFEDYKKP